MKYVFLDYFNTAGTCSDSPKQNTALIVGMLQILRWALYVGERKYVHKYVRNTVERHWTLNSQATYSSIVMYKTAYCVYHLQERSHELVSQVFCRYSKPVSFYGQSCKIIVCSTTSNLVIFYQDRQVVVTRRRRVCQQTVQVDHNKSHESYIYECPASGVNRSSRSWYRVLFKCNWLLSVYINFLLRFHNDLSESLSFMSSQAPSFHFFLFI